MIDRKTSRKIGSAAETVATVLVMLYLVFPVLWMMLSSIKNPVDLFSTPPNIIPHKIVLSNYFAVLSDPKFLNAVKNSFIVAAATTVCSLLLGTLSGYVFARYRFRGKNILMVGIMATQMMPFVIILIPLFIVMRKMHMIDTYQGMILAYMTFSVPYAIVMLNAFFKSIPFDLEEAAQIDGCSRFKAMTKVLLPLSLPGLTSTGIFVFISAWNHYIYATVLSEAVTSTFPIRMQMYMAEERVIYEHMYPAAILGTLPILLIVLIFQKNIIEGLTAGGVKG